MTWKGIGIEGVIAIIGLLLTGIGAFWQLKTEVKVLENKVNQVEKDTMTKEAHTKTLLESEKQLQEWKQELLSAIQGVGTNVTRIMERLDMTHNS